MCNREYEGIAVVCKLEGLVANMALRPAFLAERYRVVKQVLFASIKPQTLLVCFPLVLSHKQQVENTKQNNRRTRSTSKR